MTPGRILDTRTRGGPIGPNRTRSVKVTGTEWRARGRRGGGHERHRRSADRPGYITVYPTGATDATASNLNFVAGQDIANLVTAKVGTNGQVDIYNFAGDTQVLFDVVGGSAPSRRRPRPEPVGDGGRGRRVRAAGAGPHPRHPLPGSVPPQAPLGPGGQHRPAGDRPGRRAELRAWPPW